MNRKFKKVIASLCSVIAPATFNNGLTSNSIVKSMQIPNNIQNEIDNKINKIRVSRRFQNAPTILKMAEELVENSILISNGYKPKKCKYLNGDVKEMVMQYESLLVKNNNREDEAVADLLDPLSRLNIVKTGYKYLVKSIATLIPGILAAVAGIKGIGIAMETLRARQMDKINEQRRKKAQESYDKMRKDLYSSSSIDYSKDWKNIAKEFDKLKEKSPHNAEPISKIVALLRGYFASCKEDPTKKCLVLSMYGTPGCGKSSFCEDMAKILGANNPVKISYADFDPADKELSVRKQVSGKWHVGDQERGYFAYGKLVSALKHNKHPFIILDELDKLPKEIISLLWDAVDTGRINIDGEDINCEGAVFVLPTNQSLSEIKLGGDTDDKNMASKALISRIRMFKCNKPREKDYKVAITKLLARINASTKKNYKLELKYDEDIINYIAKKCVENDFGMRSIPLFDALIRGAIQEKYDKECEAIGTPSVQSIKLDINDINSSEKRGKLN